MKNRWENKNVMITGANAGLGKELILQLLPKVKTIVALDKNVDFLTQLKSKKIEIFQLDLSDAEQVHSFLLKHHLNDIDVFINNAGITLIKKFEHSESKEIHKVIQVNLLSPLYILNHLVRAGLESVVTINSIAGFAPLFGRSAYVASKFGLDGAMKTITLENNIFCMNVYPTFINTGIRTQAWSDGKKAIVTRKKNALEPSSVAKEIIESYEKGKQNLRIGFKAKGAFWLMKFFPKLYNYLMMQENKSLWQRS